MPAGRPTKYTEELVAAAEAYVSGGWKDLGDKVPSIVGLAMEIGVSCETCHTWDKEEGKEAFSDILMRVRNGQHRELINGGLGGEFSPVITKMMMTKHGYSDRQELDHKSSDGSMTPKGMAHFYAEDEDDEA